ncbi:MAG: hypothetical protein DRJ96_05425 [Thermoprotei archaeon]|nr:MAG: hypothetical protein DRJ96_05425 [Thermoprotei archaeon]
MNGWRRRKVEIRAQLMASLMTARGLTLFRSYPRSKADFWKNAYMDVEVLAIFPKEEWPRLRELLRETGWWRGDSEKLVAYFGKGVRMRRVLVVNYIHETESNIYPYASIKMIWHGNDIMLGVLAGRYENGWKEFYPFEIEQYGVNKTYAQLLIDECKRVGISLIEVRRDG